VDGYANLIAARLRKLAGEGSTGMLPMSGPGESAIYFRDGQVVYVESSRTPIPALRAVGLAALGLVHDGTRESNGTHHDSGNSPGEPHAGTGELVPMPSASMLAATLAVTEPTIDAATELLSSDYRFAKFRHGDCPPVDRVRPIPVETLLTEVDRRRAVLRQLAEIITPDTMVARQSSLDSPSAQVSRAQWAVLVRAGGGTTPRILAMQLGQSVFGTTIEVYRLIALGLLVAPGRSPVAVGVPGGRPPGLTMSFMRAISGDRGSHAGGTGGKRPDHR
jgi:hypothetical protein